MIIEVFPEDKEFVTHHAEIRANMGKKDSRIEKCTTLEFSNAFGMLAELMVYRFLGLEYTPEHFAGNDGGVDLHYHDIPWQIKSSFWTFGDPYFNHLAEWETDHLIHLTPYDGGRERGFKEELPDEFSLNGWITKEEFCGYMERKRFTENDPRYHYVCSVDHLHPMREIWDYFPQYQQLQLW